MHHVYVAFLYALGHVRLSAWVGPVKKTATITVRCTEEMRAKLATLARADGRTVSSLVKILLEQALQQLEKPSKKRLIRSSPGLTR